jgi:hypothetical protein
MNALQRALLDAAEEWFVYCGIYGDAERSSWRSLFLALAPASFFATWDEEI